MLEQDTLCRRWRPSTLACALCLSARQKWLKLSVVCTELLAQSQGPAFLLPGQLRDQIPMVVSRDQNHADASRQQSAPAQSDAEQAAQGELEGSEASSIVRRPAAGVYSISIEPDLLHKTAPLGCVFVCHKSSAPFTALYHIFICCCTAIG